MSQSQSQIQQSRGGYQFQLRLPEDLRLRIQEAANASGRSLNSEIVAALAEQYAPARQAAQALAALATFIDNSANDEQMFLRISEINHHLKAVAPTSTVQFDRNGTLTISINT